MAGRSTYLTIHNVSCNTIYEVAFNYVHCDDIVDYEAATVLSVPLNAMNEEIFSGINAIEIQGEKYTVSGVTSDDSYLYIVISPDLPLNPDGTKLSHGNMIGVFKGRVRQPHLFSRLILCSWIFCVVRVFNRN